MAQASVCRRPQKPLGRNALKVGNPNCPPAEILSKKPVLRIPKMKRRTPLQCQRLSKAKAEVRPITILPVSRAAPMAAAPTKMRPTPEEAGEHLSYAVE